MPRNKKTIPLFGAAKVNNERATDNEATLCYWLARFGWLTRHQLAKLLKKEGIKRANTILAMLQRAKKNKLVESFPLENSPDGQMLGWFLLKKGMTLAVKHHGKQVNDQSVYTRNRATGKYRTQDAKYQYHRLLSNEFVINCLNETYFYREHDRLNRITFLSEHETSRAQTSLQQHFFYVPDALIFYWHSDDLLCDDDVTVETVERRTVTICEVENSLRGPKKHGKKFNWVNTALELDKNTRGRPILKEVSLFNKRYSYEIVDLFFVTANEKIFRNIYRKVHKQIPGKTDREKLVYLNRSFTDIYYEVMASRGWAEPFRDSETLSHSHDGFEHDADDDDDFRREIEAYSPSWSLAKISTANRAIYDKNRLKKSKKHPS